MDIKDISNTFKALGDETRLQIFGMLRHGSLCACKILEKFNITQPTLSHHMKLLCDSGLVLAKRDGKWVHYSINCEHLKQINEFMRVALCEKSDETEK